MKKTEKREKEMGSLTFNEQKETLFILFQDVQCFSHHFFQTWFIAVRCFFTVVRHMHRREQSKHIISILRHLRRKKHTKKELPNGLVNSYLELAKLITSSFVLIHALITQNSGFRMSFFRLPLRFRWGN